jgi:hypothetical protein
MLHVKSIIIKSLLVLDRTKTPCTKGKQHRETKKIKVQEYNMKNYANSKEKLCGSVPFFG